MRHTGETRWRSVRLIGAAALGLVILLLPACDSMINRGGPVADRPVASAVRDPVLQDIPKPAGFTLVDDASFGTFTGKVRIARCEYIGSTDRAAVKRFYTEYMPSAGFELRRWSLDNGVFNLHFESSEEICTVRVHPTGRTKTALVVEIVPKPKGPTEHESQPPTRRPE